jgi:hypothetical protein
VAKRFSISHQTRESFVVKNVGLSGSIAMAWKSRNAQFVEKDSFEKEVCIKNIAQ